MFALGTRCGNWTSVPIDIIESIDDLGSVPPSGDADLQDAEVAGGRRVRRAAGRRCQTAVAG